MERYLDYPVHQLLRQHEENGPLTDGMTPIPVITLFRPRERCIADPKSFLDNLKNHRLVMSVASEHIQGNRDHFVKDATATQVRQFEKSVSQIRAFADRMETEFNTLEYLIGKRR